MGVVPSKSDEPSHQPSSATVSATQELGSHLLSGPVSSGPALVNEKTTMPTTNAPQLSENDTNRIIENLFSPAQIDKMHNFHKYISTGCNGISKEELDRVKMTKGEIVFSASSYSGERQAFVCKLVSGGLFMWRMKVCTAFFALTVKASWPKTETRHSPMVHPQGSSWMQSQNTWAVQNTKQWRMSCWIECPTIKNRWMKKRVPRF